MIASLNFTQALIHKKHVRRLALGASVIIAALATPVLNAQINAGASNAQWLGRSKKRRFRKWQHIY